MNHKEFLQKLFGNKPDDTRICIWTFPRRQASFFMHVKSAVEEIEKKIKEDVYVGCGLYRPNIISGRGEKKDILGVTALWMDIDIADKDNHKTDTLPTTLDDALELVYNNGFDPSMIIHSGHGIHAWWLLEKPYIFNNLAEIPYESFESYNQRLQATIKLKASKKKWKLDSTYDVTRVLRPPGTFNYKNDKIIPVKTLVHDGPIYNGLESFDKLIITVVSSGSLALPKNVAFGNPVQISQSISVNINAQLCEAAIEMLNEPKILATWNGIRKDFIKDSPSEYVMSLANHGVKWGLSDQEIVDMIAVWYRMHINNPKFRDRDNPINYEKIKRPDYLPITIAKAKQYAATSEAIKTAQMVDETTLDGEKPKDELIEKSRKQIFDLLGFHLIKIIKYDRGERDPYYDMHTDTHVIHFKRPDDLFLYNRFKIRVAAVLNTLPVLKTKEWAMISKLFKLFMVEYYVDEEQSTALRRVKVWVESYLEDKRPIDINDVTFANEPFVYHDFWHIFIKQFQNFCWQKCTLTGDIADLELDLKRAGATKVSYTYKHPTQQAKRRKINVWRLPSIIIQAPLHVVPTKEEGKVTEKICDYNPDSEYEIEAEPEMDVKKQAKAFLKDAKTVWD